MTQEEQNCRNAVISNEYQELIINYSNQIELLQLSPVDCYQIVNEDFAIAYYYRPMKTMTDILGSYSQIPKCCGLLQQQNLEEIGVARLRRIESFDYYGQGILIGLVDTGIDYTHPAFLREDGRSRVISIWDQSDQNGTPPNGFLYGTEFGTEEIAAETAPGDEIGHGTFLAGIAAGKENAEYNFAGVAPLAEIVVVKLKRAKEYLRKYYMLPDGVPAYSENDIMLGIRYLTEFARRRNQPLVMLIGVGTNAGSHTGSLPLCRYLDRLSYNLSLCLVLAAGNEGNARHHFSGQISREEQEIELQVGREENGFAMEFWTSPVSKLGISLISPSGERASLNRNSQEYEQRLTFIFDRTIVYVRYEPQERNSNRRLILFRFVTSAVGFWRIVVDGREEELGLYDIWLPMREFISEATFFPVADPYVTICEPANAQNPITVGGYSAQSGGLYAASSRGFTASNQEKPTIVGPAVNVIGPYPGGGYVVMSGTSVAMAYTAGCVALFWEFVQSYQRELSEVWNPNFIGEHLYLDTTIFRNLFSLGAVREENRSYPNRETGYGKLNLFGVFEIIRSI